MADPVKQLEEAAQIMLVSIHYTDLNRISGTILLNDSTNKILMVIQKLSTIIKPVVQANTPTNIGSP